MKGGKRMAFRRAKTMAQASRKPVHVIYDTANREYAATEGPLDFTEHLIDTVRPDRRDAAVEEQDQ